MEPSRAKPLLTLLLLGVASSGCIAMEGSVQAEKREYEPGQAVFFTHLGRSERHSSGGSSLTEAKASLTIDALDCTAIVGTRVACTINATGTARGGSKLEHEWRATLKLGSRSVEFGAGPQGAVQSTKAHGLSTTILVRLDEPKQTVDASLQTMTYGVLGGQRFGESSASHSVEVSFELAPPGKQGVPYVGSAPPRHAP